MELNMLYNWASGSECEQYWVEVLTLICEGTKWVIMVRLGTNHFNNCVC